MDIVHDKYPLYYREGDNVAAYQVTEDVHLEVYIVGNGVKHRRSNECTNIIIFEEALVNVNLYRDYFSKLASSEVEMVSDHKLQFETRSTFTT